MSSLVKNMARLLLVASLVLLASDVWSQPGRKQVLEGNELFAEEKYDQANLKYRDALLQDPDSPLIHFNIGDVLYKKRNYEEALKSYEKATASDDILLQSQAYYNMGNTLYRMGKLVESIQMYKKALELNPEDEDAKYNLEYVRAKLKQQAQNAPQQNQQQQGEQQQQGQQQPQPQQQEQNGQNENQENQQESLDQQLQRQQDGDPSQQPEPNDELRQDEQSQPQAQPGQEQEISKEDAERILEALKNEERELLKKQRAQKVRNRAFRGKDW